MPTNIEIPSMGESVTEGQLTRWLKSDGDFVQKDEMLFELETEKASNEIPSPAEGILHIKIPEGETVEVGSVVGVIEEAEEGEGAQQQPRESKDKQREHKPEPTPSEAAPSKISAEAEADGDQPRLSPAAKKLVREKNIDVAQVAGTGRGGLITKSDVLEYTEAQPEAEPTEEPTPQPTRRAEAKAEDRATRERMSPIRSRIARRLVQSQQSTATLTTFNEADLSAVMALRSKYKDLFKQKHDVGLGFMSFFVKAAVAALKAFPLVNARLDGEEIVKQHFYDIGVAVSTERGLMVPIVRDVDHLSFAEVEQQIGELAIKARDGKISIDDLQGGTFTITNGGVFGSLLSTPILNPPQCAILGMHTIQQRPVVRDNEIVIRPMMYLALSYDHRLIDGREAVQFLVRIKECVEQPERMLLEV